LTFFAAIKGGEYSSEELKKILKKYGATPQYAETDVHEHSGTAERAIGAFEPKLRAVTLDSGFPARMWGQLTEAVTYITNRLPHSSLNFQTPFEMFYKKKPNLRNLRVIGSRCYVYKNKIPKGRKIDPRANIQYLIGYTDTGYRTFDPVTGKTTENCILIVDEDNTYGTDYPTLAIHRELHFPERIVKQINKSSPQTGIEANPMPDLQPRGGGELPNVTNKKTNEIEPCKLGKVGTNEKKIYRAQSNKQVRRSKRNQSKLKVNMQVGKPNTEWVDFEFETYGRSGPEYNSENILPLTYDEAVNPQNYGQWKQAIEDELNSLKELNVFEIVPRPKGVKPIPTDWLLIEKADGKKKGRVIAKGHKDPERYERKEKASPTPNPISIKWYLATVITENWHMEQIDIQTAFLNAPIDRLKYVILPKGINVDQKKFVGRLNKPLYGFAFAPKCWYNMITKIFLNEGFSRAPREPCIFVKQVTSGATILIIVYVDDIVISSNNTQEIEVVVSTLQKQFRVKRLGKPKKYLNIEFEYANNSVYLHQSTYIEKLLTRYNHHQTVLPYIPMVPKRDQKLKPNEKVMPYPYRQVIGSLLYLANATRPDISFAVGFLARFQCNPQEIHYKLISDLLAYIDGSKNVKIEYQSNPNQSPIIELFADADYATDATRKSTSGILLKYNGCTIQWTSKLQSSIAESSAEAELRSMTQGAHDALFVARLTEELLQKSVYPIQAFEDNSATYTQCTSSVSQGRLRYIELMYFKLQEWVEDKLINMNLVSTEEQQADFLTKPLAAPQFVPIRDKILSKV